MKNVISKQRMDTDFVGRKFCNHRLFTCSNVLVLVGSKCAEIAHQADKLLKTRCGLWPFKRPRTKLNSVRTCSYVGIVIPIFHSQLTLNGEHDALADDWRDAVGRDAQVGARMLAPHVRQVQRRTLQGRHCNKTTSLCAASPSNS